LLSSMEVTLILNLSGKDIKIFLMRNIRNFIVLDVKLMKSLIL
jgi:hypothetical protein